MAEVRPRVIRQRHQVSHRAGLDGDQVLLTVDKRRIGGPVTYRHGRPGQADENQRERDRKRWPPQGFAHPELHDGSI
jgi:hypothetical protein